jgi:four helix bundle protein
MPNNTTKSTKYDLEDRLIEFAVQLITLAESLPSSRTGSHLANQLIRSGTSPALNYGEAQSSESRADFIHKIKIVLKELRETSICLRIVKRTNLSGSIDSLTNVHNECGELVAIFAKSLQTAESRRNGR